MALNSALCLLRQTECCWQQEDATNPWL